MSAAAPGIEHVGAATAPPCGAEATVPRPITPLRSIADPEAKWRSRCKPGPKPRVSGDRLASAIARYAAGKPMEQIARAAGVTTRTLRSAFRRAGVVPAPSTLAPEAAAELIGAYVQGEPIAAILERAPVSKATFYRILRRAGHLANRKARGLHSPEVLEMASRALELRLERGRGRGGRKRLREVGAALQVTRPRVSQLLRIAAEITTTLPRDTRLSARSESTCPTGEGFLPAGQTRSQVGA